MKNFLIYILTIIPIITFGQNSNTIFSAGSNDFLKWTYSDFLKSGVKKVEGYSFRIKKNGKIKKRDSTLLFRQQIDLDSNRVFGINCNLNYQSHGPAFYTWYNFSEYYNDQNLLTKYISSPAEVLKKKEYGSTKFDIDTDVTTFEYDLKGNLKRRTYKKINHYYSISKYLKDTFHLHSICRPIIDEYTYNVDNQKSKWYHTVDSTRYLKTKSYNPVNDSDAVSCSYCHSRYLNVEWIYDDKKNLVEWVLYTKENLIHTKINYSYNNESRLVKQIDSTGWYFDPYWESITTYEYTDTSTVETKVNNTEARFGSPLSKIVTTYDINNRVLRTCNYSDSTKDCLTYSYHYKNSNLTQIDINYAGEKQRTKKYTFNSENLMTEERHFLDEKLIRLIKYYYEK